MKKILSVILIFLIICGSAGISCFAENTDVSEMIKNAANYVLSAAENPTTSSISGEWAILGLARSGADIPKAYFRRYKENLVRQLQKSNGVLHDKKYTEFSRAIIALTAIGENPKDVAGFDLTAPLEDYDKTVWQGINGPVWALIAFDCGGFGSVEIKEAYLNCILDLELGGGGFALSSQSTAADTDITAMTLTALSNYRGRERVDAAIDRGISLLSGMQNERGGFSSFGTENAESAAQVLTALSSLGISYNDPRFVKNGNAITDYLKLFLRNDGGFAHTAEDKDSNLMATEQCLYSLVAAERLMAGKNTLFDMSDCIKISDTSANSDILFKVAKRDVKYPGKTFEDITNHKCRTAVEALAERGIISGMTENTFEPDGTMTRAEFSTISVMALALPLSSMAVFDDVTENDWFFPYVATAYNYNIVKGVSQNTFIPNGTITREEAAVMLTRAASLCGLNTDMSSYSARDILAEYFDYIYVSPWAEDALAYCYLEKLLDDSALEIKPREAIKRSEIAEMIYLMLRKAALL